MLDFLQNKKQKTQIAELQQQLAELQQKQATAQYNANLIPLSSFAVSFDGEKNLGAIGPVKKYYPHFENLRLRSWQSYLDSEITQTTIQRFALWVIGSGLKLQAEPQKITLKSEGIDIGETEDFNDVVESRFATYANSKQADYSGLFPLHTLAETAFINTIIGGDVLIVLRVINGIVKVQLIDGEHVRTPIAAQPKAGVKIIDGIEIAANGEHVAYWVATDQYGVFERIEAKGQKSGLTMATMVYGSRYRLNNVRGIPLISTVLETLKKLERYKEATVGSAEERQKIVYQIVHGIHSTGENPLQGQLAKAFNYDAANTDLPTDMALKELAATVAATTDKQTYNLPKDTRLESLESRNELTFKDFYTTNFDIVCAAIGIPPNVALSKYDDNFSASRAAIKDWENTINVKRKYFADQFYRPIYNLWLTLQVLTNKVSAPGFLEASMSNNVMAIEAYQNARWIGASVPHIDPVKEVEAERLKLGTKAAHIPLTTVERATENVNGGEAKANFEQFAKEMKSGESLGIKEEQPAPAIPPPDNSGQNPKNKT